MAARLLAVNWLLQPQLWPESGVAFVAMLRKVQLAAGVVIRCQQRCADQHMVLRSMHMDVWRADHLLENGDGIPAFGL